MKTAMTIDKFGRTSRTHSGSHSFRFTRAGDFNLAHRKLTNVKYPENINDAATKKYVDIKNKISHDQFTERMHTLEKNLLDSQDAMTKQYEMLDHKIQGNHKELEEHIDAGVNELKKEVIKVIEEQVKKSDEASNANIYKLLETVERIATKISTPRQNE